jgi:hypothetical protein
VSPTAWALGSLTVVIAFLALALAGLVRTVDGLRRRVAALEGSSPIDHHSTALPVGAIAPGFEAETPERTAFRSGVLHGVRHVVAFADPGCESCHEVVPELLASSTAGELPPTIVVVTGTDATTWRTTARAGGRAVVVLDPGAGIADAFGSTYTPQAFVVDEGGSVAARGPIENVAAVRRLLRDAEGLRIVRTDPIGTSVDG